MAIQNPLYGRELSEGEAALVYQPLSNTLTKLSQLAPGTGMLSVTQGGEFTLVQGAGPSSTDALPEGTTNLYLTDTRVKAAITGAVSTVLTANTTPSRVLISDTSGKVSISSITTTELSYLSGTNTNLQVQVASINSAISSLTTTKIPEGSNQYFTSQRAVLAITGAASSISTSNLLSDRVLVSDAGGKVAATTITTTELLHLAGSTSPIQAQLNTLMGRAITAGPGITGGGTLSSNITLGVAYESSASNIKASGGAPSVGLLNTVARADHVHPPDSTKVDTSSLGTPYGVATLDSSTKVPTSQIPAITTTVGFGGETISVPYTGSSITIPVPIAQGGTGVTNAASALSALGAQPANPVLTSMYTASGLGLVVKDSFNTVVMRTIAVNNPLTITNPTATTGNPTISLSQGHGSGLDADMLDGAHGTTYFKVDGSVAYSIGTASTIRGSVGAAASGANTDISSMGAVTSIGNGSTAHVQVTTTGAVGINDSPTNYGRLAVRGGMAGSGNSSLALLTPNGSNSSRVSIAMYPTFGGSTTDTNVRRAADIVVGYNGGVWGTEYLSLNVGGATDSRNVTTERVRVDGSGNLLVGTTTTTPNGGDLQVSKGLTFPAVQVPCSNTNTLDDYREGTWVPVIDSATPGTGRATTIHYASFTKVGNLITFTAFVVLSTLGTGGSGNLVINGLPYTSIAGNTALAHWAITVPYFHNVRTALIYLGGTVQPGSTQILFRGWGAATTTVPTLDFSVYMQAGFSCMLSGFYYTP